MPARRASSVDPLSITNNSPMHGITDGGRQRIHLPANGAIHTAVGHV
jgi:hypothetical protein